jgi:hypothetical protein
MTDDDDARAHKIANSWTNALWQVCLEQFGDEGVVVFLVIVSGAYAQALRFGADAGKADAASATLNTMLRGCGLGDWRLIHAS